MKQETITVELTHKDAIKLVRSVPLWTLPLKNYYKVERMNLVSGNRLVYYWDWVDVLSCEWDKYTTEELYELYNKLK